MAALSAPRSTLARSGDLREPPVKAATKIYAGAMVAIDANGWALPAAAVAAHRVIGRAEDTADNSAGANGAINVRVATGVFRWDNSASTDLIARADIGAPCYVVDDNTVAKTSNSNARPVAGVIFDVDAAGVWVEH